MIAVERIERGQHGDEYRCCMECAALMWAETGTSPLFAVTLPATGMRVLLCDRHLWTLRSIALESLAAVHAYCDRCHRKSPNENGCAQCNPVKLGERLAAELLSSHTKAGGQ